MAVSREEYLRQFLTRLLPTGALWDLELGSNFEQALEPLAGELARVHVRMDDLLREADPRTTSELLSEWEKAAGLPDDCEEPGQTIQERRNRLVEHLTAVGGQSPAFFIELAARLGFEITIAEYRPFTCTSKCNAALNTRALGWHFTFRVNAPETTIRNMTCRSRCNEPIRDWGNDVLECVIRRRKPGHTHVIFSYGG